jgi:2-polyprenyl-3-methyl-5-hydroxy-6-metoxy-1,4-benzoquinol methylase
MDPSLPRRPLAGPLPGRFDLTSRLVRRLQGAYGRLTAVDARPGERVLDIGAGWGAMTEHGGRRGVRVTSLTISEPSARYVDALIREHDLPCRVLREHFLEYVPGERFDAIVNLGVTEHLPDYAASLAQYRRLLRPGGKLYLDACSTPVKFPFSSFVYRHIFPGNATLLCLHDFLAEVAKTPFEVLAVYNDRHSYELTCRRWAENLERARETIVSRWGQALFRRAVGPGAAASPLGRAARPGRVRKGLGQDRLTLLWSAQRPAWAARRYCMALTRIRSRSSGSSFSSRCHSRSTIGACRQQASRASR